MTGDEWLAAASADAERRQLHGLAPLLQALGAATRVLRAAEWNQYAAAGPQEPNKRDDAPDA